MDKLPSSNRQQVVFLHHSQYPLAVHYHPPMTKFCSDAAVSIAPMMLNGNFLYRCPHRDLFHARLPSSKPSIESSPADLRQRTHPFHTEFALQRWHHFGDVVVDARSPLLPLRRRRSSTLCKAPLKKSAS